MNEYLLKLIQKYKQKGVLIDTNIVLLYIIGSIDILQIREFSRTAMFTEDDFYRISKFIDFFEIKITTPHVLTEASNLLGNRIELQLALKKYIDLNEEKFLSSKEIAATKIFLHFGLADSAIHETSKDSYLIFTNEKELYGYLISNGFDAVNLDQVRLI